ncbi:ATP-grasp domain-containing protein [Streptomyces roseifaciens]
MTTARTIAVVYDKGAVAPAQFAAGLSGLGELLFLLPDSAHNEEMRPLLEQVGRTLRLTGDTETDIAAVRAENPAAVLTFAESQLATTSALTSALGLPGHSPETTLMLIDKARQRARLAETGVDRVRSIALTSADEWPRVAAEVGLPAIVKPLRGEGSRGVFVVADPEEVERLVAEVFVTADATGTTVVAEELLQGRTDLDFGDYVSVESLCGPQGITHLAVTGKLPLAPPFRETGYFWPPALPDGLEDEIRTLTGDALRALGVTNGLTHTEVKLTPDGPRIIEVNGRIGGHIHQLGQESSGVDLARVAALLALGEQVRLPALRPGRVHFVFIGLAPVEPARLVAVHGEDDVRALDGIAGYRGFTRIGEELPGGVNTQILYLVWGSGADHAEMAALYDKTLSALAYDFAFADGTTRRVTPAELLR